MFNWSGSILVNGEQSAIDSDFNFVDGMVITFIPQLTSSEQSSADESLKEYRITVRDYMTRTATPDFDFMKKWNNDVPMPMRSMVGSIEKETRGMVYMKLKAQIIGEKMTTCMKCGRPLTNPVSQYFGIGPECGGHNYTHPFKTDAELKAAVAEYKKTLEKVTWEGWVIKSSIISREEL